MVGRQIGPFTTELLNYIYETLSSTGFTVDGSMAMNRISSLTPSFEYDKINNPYRPTRGWSIAAALQAAGGLFGGDTYFLRPSLRNSFYKPFLGRTYIAFHGELG